MRYIFLLIFSLLFLWVHAVEQDLSLKINTVSQINIGDIDGVFEFNVEDLKSGSNRLESRNEIIIPIDYLIVAPVGDLHTLYVSIGDAEHHFLELIVRTEHISLGSAGYSQHVSGNEVVPIVDNIPSGIQHNGLAFVKAIIDLESFNELYDEEILFFINFDIS